MVISNSITIKQRELDEVEATLKGIRNGMPRARHRAIDFATNRSRSRMVKAIRQDLPLKAKDIYDSNSPMNPRRPLVVAMRKEGSFFTGSQITVKGDQEDGNSKVGRIPLIRFGARQGQRGAKAGQKHGAIRRRAGTKVNTSVSYKIRKGRQRGKITDAFVAKMPSGYVGVFQRFGNKGNGRFGFVDGVISRQKQKIRQLYGPSVPHAAERLPEIRKIIDRDVEELLFSELNRQVTVLLDKDAARQAKKAEAGGNNG